MDPRQATFPRAARLLRPSQYTGVFARGQKFVCDGFVVIAAENGEEHARLGLALAKRRIRRSVDRSRVKRVIRESFRNVRPDLPATDIVVLARSRTATIDNASLTAQLTRIWQRLARSAQ
ncbi:MAG: ribonuclease P protein component [Salinisphaera sp.]|uniref:ribonuclease P protein component n=1 Tax=Salinisphaera sp. TaxID=1914330 RepID=UPI003C7CDE03